MSTVTVKSLRSLIAERVDRGVDAFAEDHPNLAAAIDRIELVDVAVERLEDDPEYRRAMEQAAKDEAVLHVTGRVVELIDRCVRRAMGL